MINVSNIFLDEIPYEDFFTKNLQSQIGFNLGNKTIRKGRLIIFKKSHFFIQISLLSHKGVQETFEVPIPFKTEYYYTLSCRVGWTVFQKYTYVPVCYLSNFFCFRLPENLLQDDGKTGGS